MFKFFRPLYSFFLGSWISFQCTPREQGKPNRMVAQFGGIFYFRRTESYLEGTHGKPSQKNAAVWRGSAVGEEVPIPRVRQAE